MKLDPVRKCHVSLVGQGLLCAEWEDPAGDPMSKIIVMDDAGPKLDAIFRTHRIDAFRFAKMPDKTFNYVYADLCNCKKKAGKKHG